MAFENFDAAGLNKHLADKSYVEGFLPSQHDVTVFAKFQNSPQASDKKGFPHLARWHKHIASFSKSERDAFAGEKQEKDENDVDLFGDDEEEKPAAEKKAEKDENDIDLFGDTEEEDETEEDKAKEELRNKLAADAIARKKAAGTYVIPKSMIVLDVKPYDDETDLVEMEKLVRSVEMEGLEWKSGKLVDLCYGIQKLQISCVVVDDLVSVDDVTDKIQENEDFVQSVDIVSFNKL
jgi:elongation factor 1-beta